MATPVDLRFKIEFNLNNSPKDLTFTDIIAGDYNTVHGKVLANIKGLIKITAPSGTVIHINPGWAADDFSAPDIDGSVPDWTEVINLPLDDDDLVETKEYLFEYKVTDGIGIWENSKTKEYDYVSPVIILTDSISCSTSELTSTDSTDYDVVIDDAEITPTITRAHKIVKPEGSGADVPGSTNAAIRTIGGGGAAATDIWTKTWQVHLGTTLQYNVELWDSNYWFIIHDIPTGYNAINVECSTCMVLLAECIQSFIDVWKAALGVDKAESDRLGAKLLRLLAAWMNYKNSVEAGNVSDMETYCQEIVDILQSENCSCAIDNSEVSERVTAWADSVAGGSASTFAFTITGANPAGGNNGDVHINDSTWHIWYKSAGTWVDEGSIKGDAGAAGAAIIVLENTVADTGTPAGTGETDLKTYTLVGGTLDTDGSIIYARGVFELGLNDNQKTLKIYWGGDIIATYISASLISAATKYVTMEMWVTRTGAAAQFIEGKYSRLGSPSHIVTPIIATAAKTLTSDVIIKITGQNAVAAANDIVGKQLIVEHYKKA